MTGFRMARIGWMAAVMAPVAVTPVWLEAQGPGGNCLKCTTTTTGGGSCDVNPASAGYTTCSCPCECSGFCGQQQTYEFSELGNLAAVPEAGVIVASLPQGVLEDMVAGRGGGKAFYSVAAIGEDFGLVRFLDGTWRAFPVQEDGTFVVRSCDGRHLTRVRPDKGLVAAGLLLTEISG